MTKYFALLSAQGTACSETVLTGNNYTPENRAGIERMHCLGLRDSPVPGTWTDVSDNEARRIGADRDMPLPSVSKSEFDAILAGLRFWQREGNMDHLPEYDIANDGGEALDDNAIDDLCEHLNTGDNAANAATVLQEALDAWPQFNPEHPRHDEEVNGGDLVEWFGGYLEKARTALAGLRHDAANVATPDAPPAPIAVVIEGGVLSGVYSNDPALIGREFLKVDYDVEGGDASDMIHVLTLAGKPMAAYGSRDKIEAPGIDLDNLASKV